MASEGVDAERHRPSADERHRLGVEIDLHPRVGIGGEHRPYGVVEVDVDADR